jgi:hypothetical protein
MPILRKLCAFVSVLCAALLIFQEIVPVDAQSKRALFSPASGSPIAVGANPEGVAIGDVNGDGNLDLVSANSGSDNVSILLGDGRGRFRVAPGSPVPAGPKPHLVALGDVNNDGKLDLAATQHDSNDVRIFLGRGDGRFSRAPGSPFAALQSARPHNHGLAFGDFNSDGRLDVATSNQNDSSVSVLLGDGQGSFAPAEGSPFAVGRDPYPLAVGDVNGDGRPDIVTPNVRGNTLSVLLGDGKGGFANAPGSPVQVAHRPYFVAVGDVNSDGHMDLAAAHDDITLVTILLGDGRGGFGSAPDSPVDIGHRAGKILLADVNRDGKLDLAGAAGDFVVVWMGDGRGRFAPAPGSPFRTRGHSWTLAVGDANRDGKPDFFANHLRDNSILLLIGR